jgi:hypothetical protein
MLGNPVPSELLKKDSSVELAKLRITRDNYTHILIYVIMCLKAPISNSVVATK